MNVDCKDLAKLFEPYPEESDEDKKNEDRDKSKKNENKSKKNT